jgi:small GTP-binding protein
MTNENEFFDRLGVPVEKREAIRAKLNEKLSYEPKIGVFGKTGVGKSSLCNALFGQDICPISDVEACTRDTQEVLLKTSGKGIKLLDVPGVGESQDRDEEYGKLYAKLLL